MTTYQDQPLSRRAMREAEAARAAGAPEGAETAAAPEGAADQPVSSQPVTSQPVTPEPLTYVTQGRTPLPQYDAPVAPVASAPDAPADAEGDGDPGYRYRDFSPEGRRAARLGWPAASTESSDLDYRTQGRADVPSAPAQPAAEQAPAASAPVTDAGLSRRELRALREAQEREAGIVPPSDEPDAGGSASTPPLASAPQASAAPAYAPQAYAPQASAPPAYAPQASAPPASAPPAYGSQAPATAAPEQPSAPTVAPEWLAAFAPPTPAADAPEAPTEAPAFEDILIGETVDDADDADESGPVVVAEQVREVPPPLIEPEAPTTDALASFEALFRSDTGVTPAQSTTPPVGAAPSASPVFPTPLVSTPPATAYTAPPVAPAPVFEAPQYEAPQYEARVAPTPSQAPQFEAPQAETPLTEAPQTEAPQTDAAALPTFAQYSDTLQPPSPFDQATVPPPGPAPVAPAAAPLNLAFIPPAPAQPAAETPTSSSQPPVPGERPRNHWSRQAELDDEAQPATGSLSRSVGGPATANALVLSDIPTPDIMSTPLTSTGDVLVTGSISLPASLSSTGALPTQLDESDLDHLLDPGDHQVASTDSQPVRAIRAVSTHTSSREIIGTIKPKRSNRALTVLIISAAGMAVVVVTLLVVALVSGVLG